MEYSNIGYKKKRVWK
uniref:Uncharacterized protein n=1 Tax=Anguilla anguilla TaxID=7936 RepID=A0A0E9XQQ5_ANGAN